jgi:hypothetical protein
MMLMLHSLIATLREVGFFRPEIASLQEKGAKFFPFISAQIEERKRC